MQANIDTIFGSSVGAFIFFFLWQRNAIDRCHSFSIHTGILTFIPGQWTKKRENNSKNALLAERSSEMDDNDRDAVEQEVCLNSQDTTRVAVCLFV